MKTHLPLLCIGLGLTLSTASYAQVSFDPPVAHQISGQINDVQVADINNDSYPDILVSGKAEDNSYFLNTYLNNQQGGFSLGQTYTLPSAAGQIGCGDINEDGATDILIGPPKFSDAPLQVLKGNPQSPGTFSLAPSPISISSLVTPFHIKDINGDGHLDLAYASGTAADNISIVIALGDGLGGLTQSQSIAMTKQVNDFQIVDLNGDNKYDLAVSFAYPVDNNISLADIYLQQSTGAFSLSSQLNVGSSSAGLAAVDFSGDHTPDLIVNGYNAQSIFLFKNDGVGNFSSFGPALNIANLSVILSTGDFNGDGYIDLLSASPLNPSVEFFINNPDNPGNFTAQDFTPESTILYNAPADFNKDGIADLVTFQPMSNSFSIFMNSATTTPVELKDLNIKANSNNAVINWNSGIESGLDHYLVQNSLNGQDFKDLTSVASKGSNSHYTYQVAQNSPVCYYRLAMIFTDGHTEYSDIQSLSIQNIDNHSVPVYPNPASNYIRLHLPYPSTYQIFDLTGTKVQSGVLNKAQQTINIQVLPKGTYLIQTLSGTYSFIKK